MPVTPMQQQAIPTYSVGSVVPIYENCVTAAPAAPAVCAPTNDAQRTTGIVIGSVALVAVIAKIVYDATQR